jgi:lipoic acid synthetase
VTYLNVRWLGLVPYREAEALQRAIHERAADDYLLLQEHPHVYTLGSSADPAHVLHDPSSVGADLVHADRGGDVTYHGPGQLVGYPIVSLAEWRAGQRDVVAYVRRLESVLIAALADFGIEAMCSRGYTGVWVGDEKIAAIGVRVARGRTRHGFALNVDPDLTMFDHIVPCGIRDRGVTSMAKVLGTAPEMRAVVDRVVARFAESFGPVSVDRQDVAWRAVADDLAPFTRAAAGVPVRLLGRLAEAGVRDEVDPGARRPEWMKVRARFDDEYLELKRLVRGLDLHTVCEEAGCPNIYECWADRTATFMILGDRCTRACGFCLVDTRHPLPLDEDESERVAEAVERMGLRFAVLTAVARDDLDDGGAAAFAHAISAIRRRTPHVRVEVLIPDCKGDPDSLETIFRAAPDVVNHNIETVPRLQRVVRPSASYARSLAVLARAKAAGHTTKSGIIVGLGENEDEVIGAMADLRSVGVEIVTLGQYLRPTARHLPVVRWWTPEEFTRLKEAGEAIGLTHVEASPLTRSSYHAAEAASVSLGTLVAP